MGVQLRLWIDQLERHFGAALRDRCGYIGGGMDVTLPRGTDKFRTRMRLRRRSAYAEPSTATTIVNAMGTNGRIGTDAN